MTTKTSRHNEDMKIVTFKGHIVDLTNLYNVIRNTVVSTDTKGFGGKPEHDGSRSFSVLALSGDLQDIEDSFNNIA